MADTTPIDKSVQEGTWQTVEQAAVALGLSVRTINRHIQAGKLKSRLTDGRREIFVAQPPSAGSEVTATASNVAEADGEGRFKAPDEQPATSSSPTPEPTPAIENPATPHSSVHGGQTVSSFGSSISYDVETALARADNAADKAELAVNAYQTLARSIEAQAHAAKRTAKVAWTIVAVLTIGAGIAIGWTATKLTEARMEAEHLKQQAKVSAEAAEGKSAELERVRDRLTAAQQDAARAEGRAATLAELQTKKPASRPTLVERLTSAFSGQAAPEH